MPSSGVSPIEVSMHFPPLTAVKEEPFPRWHVMRRCCSRLALSQFSRDGARQMRATSREKPVNAERRGLRSNGTGVRTCTLSDGIVLMEKAVSNTPTCGMPGINFSQTSTPVKLAGLWSGLQGIAFADGIFCSPASSLGFEKYGPPWTMRMIRPPRSHRDLNDGWLPDRVMCQSSCARHRCADFK